MDLNEVYLIAETAYSHEGDRNYLPQLITQLGKSEIDAIKFQILLDKREFLSQSHPLFNEIDKWSFNEKYWTNILNLVNLEKKDVIVTILDTKVIEFLKDKTELYIGVEIHPSCLIDLNFLNKVCSLCQEKNKTLFLGISGFNLNEIKNILNIVKKYSIKEVILIYGFQNFPTNINELDLNKIVFLKEETKCEIAYADHTEYNSEYKNMIIEAAFILGAKIQEIHCVLEKGKSRTDYITAIEIKDFSKIKKRLNLLKQVTSKDGFQLSNGEIEYSEKLKKSPVYLKELKKNEVLRNEDIGFKRVKKKNYNYEFQEVEKYINKKLRKDVEVDSEIIKNDFE